MDNITLHWLCKTMYKQTMWQERFRHQICSTEWAIMSIIDTIQEKDTYHSKFPSSGTQRPSQQSSSDPLTHRPRLDEQYSLKAWVLVTIFAVLRLRALETLRKDWLRAKAVDMMILRSWVVEVGLIDCCGLCHRRALTVELEVLVHTWHDIFW